MCRADSANTSGTGGECRDSRGVRHGRRAAWQDQHGAGVGDDARQTTRGGHRADRGSGQVPERVLNRLCSGRMEAFETVRVRFLQARAIFFRRKVWKSDFLSYICSRNGGLAQLARALAWHARGHEFDSRILHKQERFCPDDRIALFLCRSVRRGGLTRWAQGQKKRHSLTANVSGSGETSLLLGFVLPTVFVLARGRLQLGVVLARPTVTDRGRRRLFPPRVTRPRRVFRQVPRQASRCRQPESRPGESCSRSR